MRIKTYSELAHLDSFDDRFDYLRLGGSVGESTFGFDRWINQQFYQSREWKDARNVVILRDNGCDLGIRGHEINGALLVHHMNPMNEDDVIHGETWITDPEYLITTTKNTHNAIHFGDRNMLPKPFVPRRAGDTKLW